MTKKITTIASELYDILEPLGQDERKRAVQAAFTLLGEPAPPSSPSHNDASGDSHASGDFPAKTKIWMRQNTLTSEQIEQSFHIDSNGAQIIASTVPGSSNGEKCRNAYLLAGVAQLLATGEPNFTDEAARAQCTRVGSYDSTNHGKFLQRMGNEFAGTKNKGWSLTGPGLKAAAALIKELAGAQ